jgi:hypothetical protein
MTGDVREITEPLRNIHRTRKPIQSIRELRRPFRQNRFVVLEGLGAHASIPDPSSVGMGLALESEKAAGFEVWVRPRLVV